MTKNAIQLIPKHKSDSETVKNVIKTGYPAVKPILPELMKWTQDSNWPIFHSLAPFLSSLGIEIVPEIRRVLATDDYEWKWSVLYGIIAPSREIAISVKDELINLSKNTKDEAGLRELAQEILDSLGK